MNNNNYSKYLKYKTKYLELQKTMQVGGALIDDMSGLIFNNIPTILNNLEYIMTVNDPWNAFIYKEKNTEASGSSYDSHSSSRIMLASQEYDFSFRFRPHIIPLLTTRNVRGQTLHYLAGLKGNNNFIMFLYRTNPEIITILNSDNSSVLHAIAWGVDIPVKKKLQMIGNILYELVPNRDAFNNIRNSRGETWKDNLIMRHSELTHNDIIKSIGF